MSKASQADRRYTIAEKPIEAPPLAPGLHLVATPIGNLQDITLRALQTLASADVIYCEDTRVTSKLLARYSIARPLKPYHDHNAAKVRPVLLDAIRSGAAVALVSDAGTPLISDPGYKLVREALAQGLKVEMIPGPSATLMALVLSGLPLDRFLFAGFLPARQKERQKFLEELKSLASTLIFFEAPGRIEETLLSIDAVLGPRRVAVAREMTKFHEETLRGEPREIAAQIRARSGVKGEITIIVEPPPPASPASAAEIEAALDHALESLPPAKAAGDVARRYGVPRRDIYALALARKNAKGPGNAAG
ncbi:MAG: 16S rRNA (cytidine(1402)-2'-O)-methyltransferase [Aestuariivirgaceae bacterium]